MILAGGYLGYTETRNRAELKQLLGIDPVHTEWCAAFVNAVLRSEGIPGSETVSDAPLTAKSFLTYGEKVDHKKENPRVGDIIVLPRGYSSWQGHVGFFVSARTFNNVLYYGVISGNNNNSVKMEYYKASSVLSVRRPYIKLTISASPSEHQMKNWLEKILVDPQSLPLDQYGLLQHSPLG